MFRDMRALAIFIALTSPVALCPGLAQADPAPTPVHAGPQAAPPVHAPDPTLNEQLDGRRHISGCPVGMSCTPQEVLREFELESFPPPGQSPWIDERTPPGSAIEAASPRHVTRPSELRPDAPWLDHLAMPDLPVTWTKRLVDYLVFYKDDPRGHAIMADWLKAQGRYRDMILAHLRAAHLPEDLLYDAMIESSYDPMDSSGAGALGLWQFMPAGGKIYGLREDHWVDERRDPLRSTIAVVDYWRDLYARFGNWEMVLAAFNAGYGAVLTSMARYNTNDYYQLCSLEDGLPWETCLYTPKVLAAAIVGHNRALFGFADVVPDPPEQYEEVAVPVSLPLSVIARAAGASADDLKALNPQLRRGRTPPGESGYVVRVPVGAKAEVERRLADLAGAWKGYDAYVLAHGERLEDVATMYGISLAKLRRLNDVPDGAVVPGGTTLVVPHLSDAERAKNAARAKANLIASGIDGKPGQPLLVPVPDKDQTVPGKRRVFYRVVEGDTIAGIADALDISARDLAAWNAIDPDTKLVPRLVLQAWVEPDFDAAKHQVALLDPADLQVVTRGSAEHLDLAEQRTGRERVEYVADGKETLAEIAKKFGMTSHDLARINQISYDTVLAKGDKVTVYEVVDPSASPRAKAQWKKMSRRARRAARRAAAEARNAQTPTHETKHDEDAKPVAAKHDDAKPAAAKPVAVKHDDGAEHDDAPVGPITTPSQIR